MEAVLRGSHSWCQERPAGTAERRRACVAHVGRARCCALRAGAARQDQHLAQDAAVCLAGRCSGDAPTEASSPDRHEGTARRYPTGYFSWECLVAPVGKHCWTRRGRCAGPEQHRKTGTEQGAGGRPIDTVCRHCTVLVHRNKTRPLSRPPGGPPVRASLFGASLSKCSPLHVLAHKAKCWKALTSWSTGSPPQRLLVERLGVGGRGRNVRVAGRLPRQGLVSRAHAIAPHKPHPC